MGMSIDEFVEAMTQHPNPKGDGVADNAMIQRRLIDFTVQAAVGAEKLTADPNWDKFLTYLQASLDRATNERQAIVDKLIETSVFDPNVLALLKVRQAWLDGVRHALDYVMRLPKQLIENAEAVKDLELPS